MPVFTPDILSAYAARIFEAAGAMPADASVVAESLVQANLVGHDSHGVIRIKEYVEAIGKGSIVPRAEPKVVSETPTTLSVDGGYGFGQVIAAWTMERLLVKATSTRMAAGGIFHCGHIGRLAAYVQTAAERGFVALAFVNGGGSEPRVAPFGGCRPVFGTNPLAAAIPAAAGRPVVLDFSTAAVASGKIRVAKDKSEELPEGWILDRDGRPSRNPADYYQGGMLLPAAGHKGFGLALLVEALGGLLSGAGSPTLSGWGEGTTNGVFFWLLDVGTFQPVAQFRSQMAALGDVIKAVTPANPEGAVLLPGEPEQFTAAARRRAGVDVPSPTWQGILATAAKLGVADATPSAIG